MPDSVRLEVVDHQGFFFFPDGSVSIGFASRFEAIFVLDLSRKEGEIPEEEVEHLLAQIKGSSLPDGALVTFPPEK